MLAYKSQVSANITISFVYSSGNPQVVRCFCHVADRKATQLSCCNAISVIKDLPLEYLWQGILITDTHWRASVNKGYRYRVLWGIPLFTDFWIDSVRRSSDKLRQEIF